MTVTCDRSPFILGQNSSTSNILSHPNFTRRLIKQNWSFFSFDYSSVPFSLKLLKMSTNRAKCRLFSMRNISHQELVNDHFDILYWFFVYNFFLHMLSLKHLSDWPRTIVAPWVTEPIKMKATAGNNLEISCSLLILIYDTWINPELGEKLNIYMFSWNVHCELSIYINIIVWWWYL